MSDHDERLARTYRALAKEEPPEALDAAILAAARRAAVRPSLARRWAVPVSAAALLVLAVGVTLEMQREVPGIEAPTPSTAPRIDVAPPARAPEAEPKREAIAPAPRPPARARTQAPRAPTVTREEAPSAQSNVAPVEAPSAHSNVAPMEAPSAHSNVAPMETRPAQAPSSEKRLMRAAPSAALPSRADLATQGAAPVAADPLAALDAIAKLRAAGRDADADRALEQFRRRYPDYRIDEATWARVKPR